MVNLKRIDNCVEYLLALFLIIDCYTVYVVSFFPKSLLMVIVLGSLSWLCGRNIQKNALSVNWTLTVPFILFFLANALVVLLHIEEDLLLSFFVRILLIFPLFIFYFSTTEEDHKFALFYKFSLLMQIEAVVSMFFFFFGTLLNVFPSTGSVSFDWGYDVTAPNYYFLYFQSQPLRNTGCFTEGPMHNFCLCLSLLVEVFFKRKKNKGTIFLLVAAIISTVSTTGFIMLILTICTFLLLHRNTSVRYKKIMFFIMFVGCISAALGINWIIEEKLSSHSFASRSENIVTLYRQWMDSPWLGIGFGKSFGGSNSLFAILADGGIHLFLIYFISFIVIPLLYLRTKNVSCLLFYLLVFGMFSITAITYQLVIIMLLSFSLSLVLVKSKKHFL